MEHMRTIEINGVKMEIDMRHAKRVDTFAIGSPVKLLVKDYSGFKSHPAVIVGFDEFEKQPTIIVAYLKLGYTESPIEFAYIHEGSEYEICPMHESDLLPTKETVLQQIDVAIEKSQAATADLIAKRRYFLQRFGSAFKQYEEATIPPPCE